MKIAYIPLIMVMAVLACGCTAASPVSTTPVPSATPSGTLQATVAPAIPNLTGTWTGPMQGYDESEGFTDHPFLTLVMTVSEQHGRVFSGHIVFRMNGTETKSGFAGVVGRDNRTLTIAQHDGGYSTGEVLAPDEIELVYMKDGSPYSISIDSFKRV